MIALDFVLKDLSFAYIVPAKLAILSPGNSCPRGHPRLGVRLLQPEHIESQKQNFRQK